MASDHVQQFCDCETRAWRADGSCVFCGHNPDAEQQLALNAKERWIVEQIWNGGPKLVSDIRAEADAKFPGMTTRAEREHGLEACANCDGCDDVERAACHEMTRESSS